MIVNLINFSNTKPDAATSFETGNIIKDPRFLNLLEDKIQSIEHSHGENNTARISNEEILNKKDNKEQAQFIDENNEVEEPNVSSEKGKIVKQMEADEDSIEDIIEQINYILKALKKVNPGLHKQLLAEFGSIRKGLQNYINNNEMKNIRLMNKLLQFFKNLKEVIKNNNQKINNHGKINDIKSNPKINITASAEKEKNSKKIRLNSNEPKTEDKLLKKDSKFFNSKNIKIINQRKNKHSGFLMNNNKNRASTPTTIKGKLNNRMLNNFEINNIQKMDSPLDVEENQSLQKIDIQKLIERVTNKIKITLAGNRNEVTMNLKPEFLGRVNIKLVFKDNTLSGKFIVENVHAEKVFKDSLAQLKVNLQNMGLEVQNFDVALNDRENFDFNKFPGFQNANSKNETLNSENEKELMPLLVENYESLGWIAQNVNMVI